MLTQTSTRMFKIVSALLTVEPSGSKAFKLLTWLEKVNSFGRLRSFFKFSKDDLGKLTEEFDWLELRWKVDDKDCQRDVGESDIDCRDDGDVVDVCVTEEFLTEDVDESKGTK